MIRKILKVLLYPFAFNLYKARCNYVYHLTKIGYLSVDEAIEKYKRMGFMFRGTWIESEVENE